MRLMKFAIIGAALAVGVTYLLNKKEGESILDDITDNAPDWIDKAKDFAADAINNLAGKIKTNL